MGFSRRVRGLLWLATLWAVVSGSEAGTYYVATNGSDVTGDGSLENPWATPGYASKQIGPGDVLIVRSGTYVLSNYYDDIIWTLESGRSDAWITIRGEWPERPVLLGASGLSHAVDVADRCFLCIENFEIASLRDQPYSGGLWDGVSGLGFHGQSNIILRNLHIHHVECSGIALDGNISNVLIEHVHIHHTGYSSISGDYKDDAEPGWQEVTISNCLLEYAGFYKDGVEQPSDWDRPDGVGFELSEGPVSIVNTTARYGLGDGLDSKARRTLIDRCVVANNFGDGVKLWGGDSVVKNTLVYGTGYTASNLVTPWCLLVIQTAETAASFDIVHCTFFDSANRPNAHYAMTVQYDSPDIPVRLNLCNNIIAGLGPCWVAASVNLTASNNLFYCRVGEVQLEHGTQVYSIATIHSLGASNRYADPRFVSADWGPTADFHLLEDSPAIDAGCDAGVATDLESKARPVNGAPDVGAYELAPYALGAAGGRDGIQILWCVASGHMYGVEYCSALLTGVWGPTMPPFFATNHIVSVGVTQLGEAVQCFRLRQYDD